MADADLTLVVVDLSEEVSQHDRDLIGRAREQGKHLIAGNKSDLPRRAEVAGEMIPVSALTGEGIDALRQHAISLLAPDTQLEQEGGFLTSIRHEQCLAECLTQLDCAEAAVKDAIPHEMLLLDLYAALREIDTITGATTADDILNNLFSTFCIGK